MKAIWGLVGSKAYGDEEPGEKTLFLVCSSAMGVYTPKSCLTARRRHFRQLFVVV